MAAPTSPNNINTFMARLLTRPPHYLGLNSLVFHYSSFLDLIDSANMLWA